MKLKLLLAFSLCCFIRVNAQTTHSTPKGNLFIGGGDRSPELIQKLISTANLNKLDHIAILPMCSAEPDSAFYYIKTELQGACKNTVANLNFTQNNINNKIWLDSLKTAKLIFITGGDQSRFMKAVLNTPVYNAIHYAYENGSTISGAVPGRPL